MTYETASCVIEVASSYRSNDYYTGLHIETNTYADGSVEHFWGVNTYTLDSEGEIATLVNNTGDIDNYPEALANYGYHLDLYYGKTIEEVMN